MVQNAACEPAGELIASAGWIAALTQAAAAIRKGRLVVVTGGDGVGKSALLRYLAETLRQTGQPATLWEAGAPQPGKGDIVLVDDAHQLAARLLLTLVRRSGGCVLAAPEACIPELPVRPANLQIVTIPGVDPLEIGNFVGKALRAAGEDGGLMSGEAVAILDEHCAGSPGRILATLRLATFLARMELADGISARHIADAVNVGNDVLLPGSGDPEPDIAASGPAHSNAGPHALFTFLRDRGGVVAVAVFCALTMMIGLIVAGIWQPGRPHRDSAAPSSLGEGAIRTVTYRAPADLYRDPFERHIFVIDDRVPAGPWPRLPITERTIP